MVGGVRPDLRFQGDAREGAHRAVVKAQNGHVERRAIENLKARLRREEIHADAGSAA